MSARKQSPSDSAGSNQSPKGNRGVIKSHRPSGRFLNSSFFNLQFSILSLIPLIPLSCLKILRLSCHSTKCNGGCLCAIRTWRHYHSKLSLFIMNLNFSLAITPQCPVICFETIEYALYQFVITNPFWMFLRKRRNFLGKKHCVKGLVSSIFAHQKCEKRDTFPCVSFRVFADLLRSQAVSCFSWSSPRINRLLESA